MITNYQGPAKRSHSLTYWLAIGWWWAPLKWLGRVSLWVLLLPVGIWRTAAHSRRKREARERRGYVNVSATDRQV